MNGEVAQHAARRLSVDVANLSYRLALADAGRDAVTGMIEGIDPRLWQRRMVDTNGDHGARSEVVLTEEQAAAIESLLVLLNDLL